jgi:ankyrin repeat protein
VKVAIQLKQIADRRAKRSIFSGRGAKTQPLSLIEAIYFDRTERAKAIIEADPDQVRQQEPFAGLTPLHVAIFRQNVEIVRVLVSHPRTDPNLIDGFNRRPIDMCVYTKNEEMFRLVKERTFRPALLRLDDDGTVVPLEPF